MGNWKIRRKQSENDRKEKINKENLYSFVFHSRKEIPVQHQKLQFERC